MSRRTGPKIKVPILLLHVRVSVVGADIADLEELRDDLVTLAERYGASWGCRVKRREIAAGHATSLMQIYESLVNDPFPPIVSKGRT